MENRKSIYLLGALKNREIMVLGERLRAEGFDVFDEWLTPGPDADSFLLEYAKFRKLSYKEALQTYAAKQVFEFDKKHIDRCDIGIMVQPCGKSAHLEFGYICRSGKPSYILFNEEPERMDVMYQFATDIFFNVEELIETLKGVFKR